MTNHIARLCLCALSLSSLPALAIDQIKPGQWETVVSMQGMPAISPEQLEQLRNLGVDLATKGNAIVTQQCITPEQAKLKEPLMPQREDGCRLQNYKHKGNKVTGDVSCDGEIKGNGRFDMTLLSDSAFQINLSVKGSVRGMPVSQNSDINGKWIKPTCDAAISDKH